jgi:hypothetical protein
MKSWVELFDFWMDETLSDEEFHIRLKELSPSERRRYRSIDEDCNSGEVVAFGVTLGVWSGMDKEQLITYREQIKEKDRHGIRLVPRE